MRRCRFKIMDSEILKTQRGREKLAHAGHLYVRDAVIKKGTVQGWRCMFKTARIPCKARAYTDIETGELLLTKGIHSDPSDPSNIGVTRLKQALKERNGKTTEAPSSLTCAEFGNASRATVAQMPTRSAITKMISRRRKALSGAASSYSSQSAIVIPESYRKYEYEEGRWESFVIADSADDDADDDEEVDEDRIIIFGRESTRNWVQFVEKLYVDGTFDMTPLGFAQVL